MVLQCFAKNFFGGTSIATGKRVIKALGVMMREIRECHFQFTILTEHLQKQVQSQTLMNMYNYYSRVTMIRCVLGIIAIW